MELFSIRPALEKDVPIILDLEHRCFIAPWEKENILYELNENPVSNLWVIEGDVSGVVGYIDYWITFDSATICQICINPNYRKMKLGSILMTDVIKDCKANKVRNITLEVREHNEAAIRLYEKFGFEKVLVKKAYYTNGDNAIYMIRKMED